jgi:DNA-directed RNA polymerase specialized sigma24 family protein
MAKKREWVRDEDELLRAAAQRGTVWQPRASTDLELLMQEVPGSVAVAPPASLEATQGLKEALADAIEALNEEDQWIINSLLIEGLSLRSTGRVLGIPKTSLARRRDRIKRQLILTLMDSLHVRQYLSHDF